MREERRRQLLAEAELDLGRLQLLLDRAARFGLGLLLLRRFARRDRRALLGDAAGNGDADEGHQAAERREGQERQAGNDAEHRTSAAPRETARSDSR